MMYGLRVEIGTIELVADKELRTQFEVALWHQTGTAKAGQVSPLTITCSGVDPYWVTFGWEMTVERSNFSSLFCGNVISPKIDEDAGKVVRVPSQLYAYDVARWMVEGPPKDYAFLDLNTKLFEVETVPYASGPIAGRWFGAHLKLTEAGIEEGRKWIDQPPKVRVAQ